MRAQILQGRTPRIYLRFWESNNTLSNKRHSRHQVGALIPTTPYNPLLNQERMGGDTARSTTPRSLCSYTHLYLKTSNNKESPYPFSMLHPVQPLNKRYLEHPRRSQYPATEGTYILPHHSKSASPCEHNLPTPCPPSTPILVQHKFGPKPQTFKNAS